MHTRRAHEPLTVSIAIALVSLFGFVAAYLCVGIGLARLLRLYGQILPTAIGRGF